MPAVVPIIAAGVGVAGSAYAANKANKGQQQAAAATQQATDTATAEQRRQYDLSRQDQMPWLQTGTAALGVLGNLYGLNQQPQAQAQQGQVTQPQPMQGGAMNYGAQLGQIGGDGLGRQMTLNFDGSVSGGSQPFQQAAAMPQSSTTQVGQGTQVSATTTGQQPGNMASFFASPDYQYRQDESMRALTARNAALGIQDSGAAQRSALQMSGNLASEEFNNYANRLAALAGVGQTAAQNTAQLGQNFAGNFANLQMNNAQNLASSYQNQAAAQGQFGQQLAGMGAGLLNRYVGFGGAAPPPGGGANVSPGGSLYGLF